MIYGCTEFIVVLNSHYDALLDVDFLLSFLLPRRASNPAIASVEHCDQINKDKIHASV